MKNTAIGIAVIAALIGPPALAADMAVKAPPPASMFTWTGWYIGANGGYIWNNGSSSYEDDPNTTPDPINGIPGISGGLPTQTLPPSTGTHSSGGLFGGQVGYNYQVLQWVYGLEGDFDWTHISGSQSTIGTTGGPYQLTPNGAGVTNGNTNEQVSLQWLATVRGRVGFAVQDRLLLFATGGLALGEVKTQGLVSANNSFFGVTYSGSDSTVKTGYTIGGGAEWAFADRWTIKGEYLWYDLGHVSHPLNCTSSFGITCGAGAFPAYTSVGITSSSVFGSIIRVGLNYRFN
jgi:outer membrane immunogenic protein